MSEAVGKRRAAGLGRGLSALLGDVMPSEPTTSSDAPKSIAVASITPDPQQPRRHFDDAALDELAGSIRAHGVLQPIVVRPDGEGGYIIVAGERRWRASQRAQLHDIPAIVRDLDAAAVLEIALLENIQRADLNPVEEGLAYARLIAQFGHTQDALSKIVHKSRSHVANLIRLLDLPETLRTFVADGRLSMGHARALLGARDPEGLAMQCLEGGWSVRELERRVQSERSAPPKEKTVRSRAAGAADADIAMLERQLSDLLGLSVTIRHRDGAGTLALSYATLDQLDMLCQRLTGERI